MGKNKSNITVAVRIRPLIQKEIRTNDNNCIRVEKNVITVYDPIDRRYGKEGKKMHNVLHRSRQQTYGFDYVFTDHSISTIFQITAMELVEDVLQGFNACMFAYGATGSGKTFTMLGKQGHKGLNEVSLDHIFEIMRTEKREFDFQIQASYVEIYNEKIKDLLNYSRREYLSLRDDPNKGLVIAGVEKNEVHNIKDLMKLLRLGNSRRTTEPTKANAESSRSHAVLQVYVTKKPKASGYKYSSLLGKLSMIDLAGSERGTVTENRGIRLREGAKINRSLLALANCINALGDKSKKGTFVPYRDSKLTRLLKDSLGGNSKTLMMCNISPAASQFEETLNTLKYANRAKKIKTKPKENKKLVELHIAEYKNIIQDLKEEIEDLRERGLNTTQLGRTQQKNLCEECLLPKRFLSDKAKEMMDKLSNLFQEQLNMRKTICEIEVQNKMNRLQIVKDKELAKTGKGLGNDIKIEIANLENSVDFNSTLQNDTKGRLVKKINETEVLLTEIQKNMSSEDSNKILDELVKNKMMEVENLQMEANLKMYEEYNMMIMMKIKEMHSVLRENGINFEDSEEEEEDFKNEDTEETQENFHNNSGSDENDYEENEIQENNYEIDPTFNYSKTMHSRPEKIEYDLTPKKVVKDHDEFGELEDTPNFHNDRNFKNNQSRRSQDINPLILEERHDDDDEKVNSFEDIRDHVENQEFEENLEDYNNENENLEEDNLEEEYKEGEFFNEHEENLDERDDSFEKRRREEEIREMEEMGFDMGEYQGTLKMEDRSLINTNNNEYIAQSEFNKHFTLTQADINREIKKLEKISQIDINKSKVTDLDRTSTVRIEREKAGNVDWNLVVNWGEEWKMYDGGIYPETILTLEGDLNITDKDFEEMLTKEELEILSKLEIGENLSPGKVKKSNPFHDDGSDEF